jgi:hypothetical protein
MDDEFNEDDVDHEQDITILEQVFKIYVVKLKSLIYNRC